MATNIKGFYRQAKKPRISKTKPTTPKPKNAVSCGSNIAQPPALTAHGSLDLQDEWNDNEEVLRQFDMNMAYGPCIGMSRLARWERACAFGLHPPEEIKVLLLSMKADPNCIWEDRV